jgi:hypothetical protein
VVITVLVLTHGKAAAQGRLHPQRGEEVGFYAKLVDALQFAIVTGDVGRSAFPGRDLLETGLLAIDIGCVGRADRFPTGRIVIDALGHHRQAVQIERRHGLPQNGIGDAEDGRGGADAQRQSRHRGGRIARRLA